MICPVLVISLVECNITNYISVCLVSFPDTSLQDNTPAGIIYAEDIQDISSDYEEAQKDISKVLFMWHVMLCDCGILCHCGNLVCSTDSHLRL